MNPNLPDPNLPDRRTITDPDAFYHLFGQEYEDWLAAENAVGGNADAAENAGGGNGDAAENAGGGNGDAAENAGGVNADAAENAGGVNADAAENAGDGNADAAENATAEDTTFAEYEVKYVNRGMFDNEHWKAIMERELRANNRHEELVRKLVLYVTGSELNLCSETPIQYSDAVIGEVLRKFRSEYEGAFVPFEGVEDIVHRCLIPFCGLRDWVVEGLGSPGPPVPFNGDLLLLQASIRSWDLKRFLFESGVRQCSIETSLLRLSGRAIFDYILSDHPFCWGMMLIWL